MVWFYVAEQQLAGCLFLLCLFLYRREEGDRRGREGREAFDFPCFLSLLSVLFVLLDEAHTLSAPQKKKLFFPVIKKTTRLLVGTGDGA